MRLQPMAIPSGTPMIAARKNAPKIRLRLAIKCSANVAPAKPSLMISMSRENTSNGEGKKIGLINPASVTNAHRARKNSVEKKLIRHISLYGHVVSQNVCQGNNHSPGPENIVFVTDFKSTVNERGVFSFYYKCYTDFWRLAT